MGSPSRNIQLCMCAGKINTRKQEIIQHEDTNKYCSVLEEGVIMSNSKGSNKQTKVKDILSFSLPLSTPSFKQAQVLPILVYYCFLNPSLPSTSLSFLARIVAVTSQQASCFPLSLLSSSLSSSSTMVIYSNANPFGHFSALCPLITHEDSPRKKPESLVWMGIFYKETSPPHCRTSHPVYIPYQNLPQSFTCLYPHSMCCSFCLRNSP